MFNQFVKDNEGKVKVAAQFDTGEQYGVGMKLGDDALKNVVDGCHPEAAKADGTLRRDLRQVDRRHPAGRRRISSSTAPSEQLISAAAGDRASRPVTGRGSSTVLLPDPREFRWP